jgi:hypothetical protein
LRSGKASPEVFPRRRITTITPAITGHNASALNPQQCSAKVFAIEEKLMEITKTLTELRLPFSVV